MGIMVYSLLLVRQDLYQQPYHFESPAGMSVSVWCLLALCPELDVSDQESISTHHRSQRRQLAPCSFARTQFLFGVSGSGLEVEETTVPHLYSELSPHSHISMRVFSLREVAALPEAS